MTAEPHTHIEVRTGARANRWLAIKLYRHSSTAAVRVLFYEHCERRVCTRTLISNYTTRTGARACTQRAEIGERLARRRLRCDAGARGRVRTNRFTFYIIQAIMRRPINQANPTPARTIRAQRGVD